MPHFSSDDAEEMKINCIISLLICLAPLLSNGQTSDYGAMQIFEGSTAGATVNLMLRDNSTYHIRVTQIFCSLCDRDELRNNIDQKGNWSLLGDTIRLAPTDTIATWDFLRLDKRKLQPLFSVDRVTYQIENDSLRNRILTNMIASDLFTFDLFYETHSNGIVKTLVDRRTNNQRFEISVSESGHIEKIKRAKGKQVTELK